MNINELENINRTRYYECGYMDYYELANSGGDETTSLPEVASGNEFVKEPMTEFIYHWFGLYNMLTSQEANAIYSHLKMVSFKKEQRIIGSAELNERLYFLNKGHLDVYIKEDGCINGKQTQKPGSVIGAGTFFSGLENNTPVIVLENAELDYLERIDLVNLEDKFPDLEMKLKKFCTRSVSEIQDRKQDVEESCQYPVTNTSDETTAQMNDSSELSLQVSDNVYNKNNVEERRQYPRIKTTGLVTGHLVDHSGISFEFHIQGTLNDISKGGFSFDIISIEGMKLIGKELDVVLHINMKNQKFDITWGGIIVDVKEHEQNYRVHIAGYELTDGQ